MLREAGLDLLLYNLSDTSARQRFFERLPLRRRVDAVLTIAMPLTPAENAAIRGLGVPVVVAGLRGEGARCVRIDETAAMRLAVDHLVGLGHRRIGHLAAAFDAPTFDEREAARRQVLAAAGLDPDALPRVLTDITIDDAQAAGGALLDEGPTAVMCDDDIIAAGLYLAARERRLRIPADVSVVGFDDMDFARVLEPALTTVALDAELLGATAFALLVARMNGGRARRPTVLPAELIVRGSTGPPR